MFDTHQHTVVPPDTIDRIERSMVEAAHKAAVSVVEQSRYAKQTPGLNAGYAGETGSGASIGLSKPYEAPRLEPFYYEVKFCMQERKLTEKQAERHVRKSLIEHAIWQITDPAARAMAQALVALI